MNTRPRTLSSHSALSSYGLFAPLTLWKLSVSLRPLVQILESFPASGDPWSSAMPPSFGRGRVTNNNTKCKKPYTSAEELIKPCAEKMVKIKMGSWAKKKIHQVSLSNDIIRRRIDVTPANVCQQVCSEIKQSKLQTSTQLDESTDSALESHLIAFARYEKDRKMKEEFLFSNTLSATTAADVKDLVDSFLKPTSSAGRISSTSVLTVPQR